MKAGTAKELGFIGLAGLIVAGGWAGLMMYAAWDHNPQGAFHEMSVDGSHVVHWSDWIFLGASWFVPLFLSVAVLGLVLRSAIAFARRRAV
jgi:hypothetical protein